MPAAPAVSVVCATYRRPAAVRRLLAALAAQDLAEPFEIIISDDGSGDVALSELRAAIEDSALDVRLLASDRNQGAAAARNNGWRAASAELIAFTDDDCQPEPGWLRGGVEALASVNIAIGRVLPDPSQSGSPGPWSRTLHVSTARFFQTANAFYRRADLQEVGGFDQRLRSGEDTDLGLRLLAKGRSSAFLPDALVLHDVRSETVWRLAKERATKWTDLPLVIRKHPDQRSTLLYKRWFWKQSHPPVLLALIGLAVAPWVRTRSTVALEVLLLLPWLVDRGVVHPPATGLRWRLMRLPGTFLVDSAEVVSLLRGSVRHRTLVL